MPSVFKNPDQYTLPGLVESIAVHVSGSSQHRKFQILYRDDRVAFAYDCFPPLKHTLAPYQAEMLGYFDEGESRVAVRGPHGLGKTLIAALLVHHAVLTSEEDCKVPTTASAWRQLEKYLWPEIKKLAKYIAWSVVGREQYDRRTELMTNSIRLNEGIVEAFALASDQHELIEGAHASRLVYVFDEAKTIPVPTWDAAEGAFANEGLADADLRAFAISTPGPPSGRFFDIHERRPGYEDWLARHVTLDEAIAAGRISRKWADQRAKQWGVDSGIYQNRVLGEFADDSEEGIIPRSWVRAANVRYLEWDSGGRQYRVGKRSLGVDTARKGEDSTVIACRDASVISNIHSFQKLPVTGTAGHIHRLNKGHFIHIEMDGGLGAAVYDILKEQDVQLLRPIIVGGKTAARDRSGALGFQNVRAAMWWNLREMLDPQFGDGIALPKHALLEADLVTPRWETKSNGVIALEAKKSIISRLGRSTDYGDAVCLAFWESSAGGGVVF